MPVILRSEVWVGWAPRGKNLQAVAEISEENHDQFFTDWVSESEVPELADDAQS